MKKKYLFIQILSIILISLSGCEFHQNKNNNNVNSTKINRTGFNQNINNIANSLDSKTENKFTIPIETELGTFTTNILDKEENRQSNIKLTCSKLNNFELQSGETFSLLKTLAETSERTRI